MKTGCRRRREVEETEMGGRVSTCLKVWPHFLMEYSQENQGNVDLYFSAYCNYLAISPFLGLQYTLCM